MTASGLAFFDTAIGACGVAWNGEGIIGVQLPGSDERATRTRLQQRFPQARAVPAPPAVAQAIDGIVALLSGERTDLEGVALDMREVDTFRRRVYDVARTIPPGSTMTYGEIAEQLGDRTLARDVGQALAKNPFAIIVPCHRVLAAGGQLGGFSASGGVDTKRRMLLIERAPVIAELSLFDELDR